MTDPNLAQALRRRADIVAAWLVTPAVAGAPARLGVAYAADRAPTHYEMYDDLPGELARVLGGDLEVVDLSRAAAAMVRSVTTDGAVVFERHAGTAQAWLAARTSTGA